MYSDEAIAVASQQAARPDEESGKQDAQTSEVAENSKLVLTVNEEGRYICQLCDKTFKTVSHRSVINVTSYSLRSPKMS